MPFLNFLNGRKAKRSILVRTLTACSYRYNFLHKICANSNTESSEIIRVVIKENNAYGYNKHYNIYTLRINLAGQIS